MTHRNPPFASPRWQLWLEPRRFHADPRGTLRMGISGGTTNLRLTVGRRNVIGFFCGNEHLSGFTGTNGKPLASVHDRRSAGDATETDMRWTPDAESTFAIRSSCTTVRSSRLMKVQTAPYR